MGETSSHEVLGHEPPVGPSDRRQDRGPSVSSAVAVRGNRFPKALRLQANRDFRQAYDQDHAAHGRWMVVFRREGAGAAFRLGVVASKRVGGSPARARAKRRLREAYRLNRRAFAPGQGDIVVVARRGVGEADWGKLVAEFRRLAVQAGFCLLPEP